MKGSVKLTNFQLDESGERKKWKKGKKERKERKRKYKLPVSEIKKEWMLQILHTYKNFFKLWKILHLYICQITWEKHKLERYKLRKPTQKDIDNPNSSIIIF